MNKLIFLILAFLNCLTGFAITCETDIRLETVLSMVKNNHPVIKMAVLSNKISDSELISAQGAFDVNLRSHAYYNRYNSSSALGQVQYANVYNSELDLLTRYGLLVKSGFDLNRGDIKTPNSPTGSDGEYFVGIDAPLLKGANLNDSAVNETLSEYNIQKINNNYRLVSIELLFKAINSYWKWAAANNKLKIEKQLLKLAEFRLKAVKNRANSGDLAAVDFIEVKQEVQKRKSRVITADRYYQKLSYELSWFLWDQKLSKTFNVLACSPKDFNKEPVQNSLYNTKDGKLFALKNRPEIKGLEISRLITNVQKEFAENDLLPRLDISLRAGKQLGKDSINGGVIKGGFEFELPIQRRNAKGRVAKFAFELDKINFEQKNLMQKIFLQVEDSISAIDMSIKNIAIVKEELKLASQMESAENKKFDLGDSTLFVLNRRERSTAEARIKLIDIMFEYYLALGYFRAVTGQLI